MEMDFKELKKALMSAESCTGCDKKGNCPTEKLFDWLEKEDNAEEMIKAYKESEESITSFLAEMLELLRIPLTAVALCEATGLGAVTRTACFFLGYQMGRIHRAIPKAFLAMDNPELKE